MKRTDYVLWAIFISLLLVLLPHTAWFFSIFENTEPVNIFGVSVNTGVGVSFFAAFAFEAAIAALVHKLAEHIREVKTPNGKPPLWVRRALARYANVYSVGLLSVVSVSTIANYAHAMEFGKEIAAFTKLGVPLEVYSVVAGGILPVCSLLFASVLSNVKDTEQEQDPELAKAKEENRRLNTQLKQANDKIQEAERTANKMIQEAELARTTAEQQATMYAGLLSEAKKDRVLAAHHLWPSLPYSSLEAITGASPAYISDVLNKHNGKV